jgi:alpha-beta hydrolase superfamily lysophospholipase
MNHVRASWRCPSGRDMPYEYWEVRQGLYARVALVLPDPFVPFHKEEKFLKLLVDLRFKVYCASPPLVAADARPVSGLEAAASDIAAFVSHLGNLETLPLALFALSFSALPALYATADFGTDFRFAVLAAPVLDWATVDFQAGFCLDPRLALSVEQASLVSSPEYIEALKAGIPAKLYASKRLVKDMRGKGSVAAGFVAALAPRLPLLVISGEDDPLTGQVALSDLKKAYAESVSTFKSYPRAKHLLALDKYWNHAANDIEEFVSAR